MDIYCHIGEETYSYLVIMSEKAIRLAFKENGKFMHKAVMRIGYASLYGHEKMEYIPENIIPHLTPVEIAQLRIRFS